MDYHRGAMLAQLASLPRPVDSHHEAELAGPASFDPGKRVLEHRARVWPEAECLGAGQVGIRRGLAAKVPSGCDHAIDPRIEQVLDSRGSEYFLRIGAR